MALAGKEYSTLHKAHGIDQHHWEVLTQEEYWTADEARAVRSILANVVEVALTIAGMPSTPLPGQYVAATIAIIVHPTNYMLAAMKAPDTFDAFDAAGLVENTEIKPMSKEQMMALVIAYAGDYPDEPSARLDPEIATLVEAENTKEPKNRNQRKSH